MKIALAFAGSRALFSVWSFSNIASDLSPFLFSHTWKKGL